MTSTGPSILGSRLGPVTITAISSRRSTSGSSPVISQSIQMRFWSLLGRLAGAVGTSSDILAIVADGLNFSAMSASYTLTLAFAAFLLAGLIVKFWLASRQIRYVAQHRDAVPPPFAATVALPAHQKAADYTIAKTRFGLLELAFGTAVLLGWTLLGGLDALNQALIGWLGSGMAQQLALVTAFAVISGALDLPFTLYQTFVIEERFGF